MNQGIQVLSNAKETSLTHANLNIVNNTGSGPVTITNESSSTGKGLRKLHKGVLKYAGQTTDRPDAATPCLLGTRKTALGQITSWRRRQQSRRSRSELVWVTGPAGTGKTSVAESTCEMFRKKGLLVAECFFSQSIGRTSPQYLPLTLAYQLAVSSLVLRPLIEDVVLNDPSIINASINTQFQHLIVEPLEKAGAGIPPIFIIIDGLDECGTRADREQKQKEIIHLLQALILEKSLPIRLLISSRPEIWIANALSAWASSLSKISLDQDKETDNDIRFFYVNEFERIRQDPELRNLLPAPPTTWPSKAELDKLVRSSSGQFVYAKTVVRFLSDPNQFQSLNIRLLQILQQPSISASRGALHPLDSLYMLILSYATNRDLTLTVLGCITQMTEVSKFWVASSKMLRELLSILEVLLGLDPSSAYQALRYSHSVVYTPEDLRHKREVMSSDLYRQMLEDKAQYPRIYHKSFSDFLHDSQRAGAFYVNPEDVRRNLAIACLRVLQKVAVSTLNRLHAVSWYYAFWCWGSHCLESGNAGNKAVLRALHSLKLTSQYFVYREIDRSSEIRKSMKLLCLIEMASGNAEDSLKEIRNILQSVDLNEWNVYWARNMWWWAKSQTDINPTAFLKPRAKLWYLHKVADKYGSI